MSESKPEFSTVSYSYTHSETLPGSSPDFYNQADNLKTSFDQNRDPYIAAQMADAGKTEAERRREAMGQSEPEHESRESFMIRRQQPKPVLRPSPSLSMGADRIAFDESLAADDRKSRQVAANQDHSPDLQRQQFIDQRREALTSSHEQTQSQERDQQHH